MTEEQRLKNIERATKWNKEHRKRRKQIALKHWYKRSAELKDDPIFQKQRKTATLKHDHGITLEQFNQMLQDQGNKCAICGKIFTNENKMTKPHVDHDHNTGRIRSLLCHNCNISIGAMQDSPDILRKAASYLEQYAVKS